MCSTTHASASQGRRAGKLMKKKRSSIEGWIDIYPLLRYPSRPIQVRDQSLHKLFRITEAYPTIATCSKRQALSSQRFKSGAQINKVQDPKRKWKIAAAKKFLCFLRSWQKNYEVNPLRFFLSSASALRLVRLISASS